MTGSLEDTIPLARLRRIGAGDRVLSVYLPIDVGQAIHHAYEARLMDILAVVRESLDLGTRQSFEAEADAVLRFVREDFTPGGRTLVLMSSTPRGLFESFTLQSDLPGLARYGAVPYLAPLEAAAEDYPRVAIAVVDERQARLLVTFAGALEPAGHFKDPVPGRQRQGGWSAFKYERDRAHHVHEHLVHVAGELKQLYESAGFKRLVLGGTPEVTAELTEALAPPLHALVAGDFRAEMFATDTALVEAALPIAERAERDEERRLVEEIRDRAYAGGNASLGRDETLQVLKEGRVHRLAIAACLLGSPEGDEALALAWDSGAAVEFLHGEAEALIVGLGGMGSLLRY